MHPKLTPEQLADLASRYVGIWNIRSAEERRAAVERLWAPGATHHFRIGSAHGHDALDARVASSHQRNVLERGFHFRIHGAPLQLADGVLLHWDMVRPPAPALEAFGLAFLHVADDGRLAADYQFVLPTPANP